MRTFLTPPTYTITTPTLRSSPHFASLPSSRMSSSEPQSSSLAAPSGADAGSDRISYDGYAPQSYMDRHVVRHLRHMRDKEYIRIAWRNCKEYSAVYQACTESTFT